jgi:hypothetical protein
MNKEKTNLINKLSGLIAPQFVIDYLKKAISLEGKWVKIKDSDDGEIFGIISGNKDEPQDRFSIGLAKPKHNSFVEFTYIDINENGESNIRFIFATLKNESNYEIMLEVFNQLKK